MDWRSTLELAARGDAVRPEATATGTDRLAIGIGPTELAERLVCLLFAHGIHRPERQGSGGGAEKEVL